MAKSKLFTDEEVELYKQKVHQCSSISEIKDFLSKNPCRACSLGTQSSLGLQVLYRGNPDADILLVGEAPGLEEDRQGLPFVGPAGQKLDKMFDYVGISTNREMLLTNVVLCRPIAPKHWPKQNLTPKLSLTRRCSSIWAQHIIKMKQPKLLVLCGGIAAHTLLKLPSRTPMYDIAAKPMVRPSLPNTTIIVMNHPAQLLHAQRTHAASQIDDLRAMFIKQLKIIRKAADTLEISLERSMPSGI